MKKLTKLTITNVGLIEGLTVELNKPLLLFYGDIRQGKSTILNAVRWCFGGSFPDDIIRHGAEEAAIRLDFEGGWIAREFYRGKSGETKARAVEFVDNSKVVPNPVAALKEFLNPFLLNQEYLRDMTELERKRYFVEVFGLDTKEFDEPLRKLEADASALRITIKTYGDVDVTPVEPVDSNALKAQLAAVRKANSDAIGNFQLECTRIREHNIIVEESARAQAKYTGEVARLEAELAQVRAQLAKVTEFLAGNSTKPLPTTVNTTDTAPLESAIENAAAQNVRHEQHKANLAKAAQKAADKETLLDMERQERELRQAKLEKLRALAAATGIVGLEFHEDLSFSFQGTAAGMLSTSQLMALSSAISSLYPESFGLELIDRAESLGASIFQFVDKAKREDKTILATIVGERPSKSPEEVGVFVVTGGKVA